MSEIGEAIEALFGVLEEERKAIRGIDGAAVEETARRKEALATTLAKRSPEELADHAPALSQLRAELRRNGILLAHARSCLQHAVDLLHPRKGNARQGTLRTSI